MAQRIDSVTHEHSIDHFPFLQLFEAQLKCAAEYSILKNNNR